ncbi:hypothetical protein SARC_03255 [Sphaeroforma arctica JP610]|uniref:RING-type domain-containing protein n=1 Tax=Sphaeroforma arctica JP610 TaxID=667725 RepID=A0A0L0G6E6_9EUKA|nr:hypothetical protein SARC_03255 [Sphaeroforma arctica JP610]KNC84529.1 hypothetical protein SARC_03255 [Sphaeroforma arctica JP610]|eukprot:XP_014158431.1 hypothetical protein SARC_03255 [Sphaeroforma arctica JP610]
MDISPNSHIQGPAENTLTTDPGLTTQAQDCTTGMNTPTQQGVPLADSTATTVAVKGLSSSSPDSAIAYQAPSDRTDKHIHADKDQSPDPVTTSQQKAPDGEVTGDLSGQVNKSPTGHAESSAVEQSAWVCVGGRKVHARDAKCNGVRAHDAEGTAVPTPEVKDSEAAHADAEKDSPSNNQPHTSPQAQAQAHQVYRGQGETTGPTEIQTQALRCAALSAEGRSSEAETTQNGGSMTREKESESESEGKAKRLSLTGPLNPNAKEFSGATRFMSSGKDGQGCATATADNNAIATADNNAIATADDSAIATDDNNATDVIDVDTIDCETTTAAHNLISEVTGHAGYNKPSAKQSDSQDMPHKPPTGHNSHHNPSHSHSHKKEKGARGGRGGHRGQQANANGHTKQSKGRHGGGGGGSYRDKEQYQRRSHFRLTDESNDDLGQYGDDVILDTFDGNHGNQTNRKGLANQMSLNHLLRFSYGDVPNARAGRYGRRQQNSTHSEKNAVFKKGQYMQANCQFVLRDSCGVLNQHLRNPDKEVDWRNVEEVRMFFTASENMLCPICLSPPSPAKTTPCGHVYCYGCVLHYLHMSAGAWSECPICHEPICAAELRSMTPVEHPSVEVHTPIDMRLLVKQGRSCIYPTPVDVAVTTSGGGVREVLSIGRDSDPEARKYTNLLQTSAVEVQRNIVTRERSELELKLNDSLSCGETEEVLYLQIALEKLRQRSVALHEAHVATTETHDHDKADQPQHTQHLPPPKQGRDELERERDSEPTFLYQATDGRRIYMHSINVRCLVKQFGSLSASPPGLTGKILDLAQGTVTHETRKKLRYLSHLPLSSQFLIAELDLDHLLSDEVIAEFHDETQKLKQNRERKAQRIKQEETRIIREEEALALSKAFKHDVNDENAFPLALSDNLIRGSTSADLDIPSNGHLNRTPTPTHDAFPSMSPEDAVFMAVLEESKRTAANELSFSFAGATRNTNAHRLLPSAGKNKAASDDFDWPTIGSPATSTALLFTQTSSTSSTKEVSPPSDTRRKTFFSPPPVSVPKAPPMEPLQTASVNSEWAPDFQTSFQDSLNKAFVDLDTIQVPADQAHQGKKKKGGKRSKQVLFSTTSQRRS